jgi:hypothetical protein
MWSLWYRILHCLPPLYRVFKKSLSTCFYTVIVRCTDTFWSPVVIVATFWCWLNKNQAKDAAIILHQINCPINICFGGSLPLNLYNFILITEHSSLACLCLMANIIRAFYIIICVRNIQKCVNGELYGNSRQLQVDTDKYEFRNKYANCRCTWISRVLLSSHSQWYYTLKQNTKLTASEMIHKAFYFVWSFWCSVAWQIKEHLL